MDAAAFLRTLNTYLKKLIAIQTDYPFDLAQYEHYAQRALPLIRRLTSNARILVPWHKKRLWKKVKKRLAQLVVLGVPVGVTDT